MVDDDRIRVVRVPMKESIAIIAKGNFGYVIYLNDSASEATEKEVIEKLKKDCEDYIFKI